MTTVSTPSTTLVRPVTVVTTRCCRRSPSSSDDPSHTQRVPGLSGNQRLSIVVGFENASLRSCSYSGCPSGASGTPVFGRVEGSATETDGSAVDDAGAGVLDGGLV